MKTLLAILLLTASIFASMVEIPVRCIAVDNDTIWLSDINQPKLTVFPSIGEINASSGFNTEDFNDVEFKLVSVNNYSHAYTFTVQKYDKNRIKEFSEHTVGFANCVSKTIHQARFFINRQKAPYVHFTDRKGITHWAHITRQDSVAIASTGGKTVDKLLEPATGTDAITAANLMYNCEPGKMSWLDTYNEVDYILYQWQASREWFLNGNSLALRHRAILNKMPRAVVGCIDISSIPSIADMASQELIDIPCEENGKKYYECLDKR